MDLTRRFRGKVYGIKGMESVANGLKEKQNFMKDDELNSTFESGKAIINQDLSFKSEQTYIDKLKNKVNNLNQFDRRSSTAPQRPEQIQVVSLTQNRRQVNPTKSQGPLGSHTARQLYRYTNWGQTKKGPMPGFASKGLLVDGVLFKQEPSGLWRNTQTGALVRLR